MKINLGCGKFKLNGFINIDIDKSVNPDLVWDIKKLPYEDNSIEEIYFGHCLEHFTLIDARKVLKECYRVLNENGFIGIVVPEKDLTPKNMINGEDSKYMKHHSYWDMDLLKKEVKKGGFKVIEEMDIKTYPYLVARPLWQIGVIAYKSKKIILQKSSIDKIGFNEREYSWCKNENKVVYNPTKKRHCPFCKELL